MESGGEAVAKPTTGLDNPEERDVCAELGSDVFDVRVDRPVETAGGLGRGEVEEMLASEDAPFGENESLKDAEFKGGEIDW